MKHLRTILKLFTYFVAMFLTIFLYYLHKSFIVLICTSFVFGYFMSDFNQKLEQWCKKIILFFKRPSDLYLIEMAISWIEDYKKSLLDFSLLGEENQWYCLYEIAYYRNELFKRKIIQ